MREIKFRGKSLKDGRWVYGYLCTDKYINENGTEWLVDPETICQYTGLKDKNGVEIFEGDVCVITVNNIDEEDGYFAVRWDNGGARYILDGDGLTVDFDNVYSYECEVIGNVWDNPELLEVAE